MTQEKVPNAKFNTSSIDITLSTCPYEKGVRIFTRKNLTLEPGLNVLVGCNGHGKTSLLTQIASAVGYERVGNNPLAQAFRKASADNNEQEKEQSKPKIIFWDSCAERKSFLENAFASGNSNLFDAASLMISSSEGEGISIAISKMFDDVANCIHSKNNDLFIFVDSLDSGLDDANSTEIVEALQCAVDLMKKNGKDCYVVITANSYGVVSAVKKHNGTLIDARRLTRLSFKDYDEYADYIQKTLAAKRARIGC